MNIWIQLHKRNEFMELENVKVLPKCERNQIVATNHVQCFHIYGDKSIIKAKLLHLRISSNLHVIYNPLKLLETRKTDNFTD